jgi:hypothetical protein
VLSVPREGDCVPRYFASCRQVHDGLVLRGVPVPVGIYAMVPVTKPVDSAEGVLRVPLFTGKPSFKAVLLALGACEYCGEATSDGSDTCYACGLIYDPIECEPDEPWEDGPYDLPDAQVYPFGRHV